MIETTETEIDVEQLMMEIRAAVARREASGQRSLVGASIELHKLLSNITEPPPQSPILPLLELQPEFVPREDDHYYVNDLLKYHDQTFIWNAYRAILKREPDEPGLQSHLSRLRSGRHNKIDILASLRFSMEGKRKGVHVEGLTLPAFVRRLYRVPVVGYLFEMAVEIVRLPKLVRSQRQVENHLIAQQQLLTDHLNKLISLLTEIQSELSTSFQADLAALFEEQRTLALVQHQQVMGLFREQRGIIRDLEQLRDRPDVSSFGMVSAPFKPSLQALPQPTAQQAVSNGKQREMDEFFVTFADRFRGSREEVKAGLRRYLSELEAAGIHRGILDLGCGRGEWLELLREAKFNARGVESNHEMALEARERGLEVTEQDALGHLKSLPDISVGAITGFHFVEHLTFETLFALLAEIKRVLKPEGLLIFETPNPKNLAVAACNFYCDPTHHRPLFPETLQALLEHTGFENVRLEYLNPVDDDDAEVDRAQWPPALRGLFFGPRDYSVTGRKPELAAGRFKLSRIEKASAPADAELESEDQTEQLNLTLYSSARGYEYYARLDTEDRIVFEAIVDQNEYELPDYFEPDDVVIDIGAHIGGFSLSALERGAARVYAYEAHPINYAIARRNLLRFGERAICHNRAVWRSDQPAQKLYNTDLTAFEHTGGISVLWNTTGIPVESISLDEILKEASNDFQHPIRLLKLHCEGSEYPILYTAKRLGIVQEIRGEYHEIKSEEIPDRARIRGATREFNRQALKDFLESTGWAVEVEPHEQDESLGRFRAWRRKLVWQSGQG